VIVYEIVCVCEVFSESLRLITLAYGHDVSHDPHIALLSHGRVLRLQQGLGRFYGTDSSI
jgi:hypothetical protein